MGQLYSAKDLLTRLASINTSYYVETTRRVAAINLPWIFNTLYGLAKPFIPQRSLAKIKVRHLARLHCLNLRCQIITNAKDIDAQMSEDMELISFNAAAVLCVEQTHYLELLSAPSPETLTAHRHDQSVCYDVSQLHVI